MKERQCIIDLAKLKPVSGLGFNV